MSAFVDSPIQLVEVAQEVGILLVTLLTRNRRQGQLNPSCSYSLTTGSVERHVGRCELVMIVAAAAAALSAEVMEAVQNGKRPGNCPQADRGAPESHRGLPAEWVGRQHDGVPVSLFRPETWRQQLPRAFGIGMIPVSQRSL